MNERNFKYVISIFGDDYSIENKSRGEISFHCPFCPELGHRNDDKKLYVNVNKLVYHCFRCESKGYLSKENSSEFDDVDILKLFSDYFSNDKSTYEYETSYFRIPEDRVIDYKNSEAYKYMKSRGFTDDDIEKYSMRIPGIGDLLGRVVVPNVIISKNWTDIYVARTYMNHPNRYKNPNNSRKSKILFNYHNIPDNPEYMILNEGPLNSIIAGDLSVASFGKSLSIDQRKMIINKNPKKLYISYDTDARDKAIHDCDDFANNSNIEVYLVELPEVYDSINKKMKGLDAVDLGRSRYLDIVFNTERFINSKIYTLMKNLKRE